MPWVTSHSMPSAGPYVPNHTVRRSQEIPGARLLQLQRADHSLERTDWETIVHAIHEHTGEAR